MGPHYILVFAPYYLGALPPGKETVDIFLPDDDEVLTGIIIILEEDENTEDVGGPDRLFEPVVFFLPTSLTSIRCSRFRRSSSPRGAQEAFFKYSSSSSSSLEEAAIFSSGARFNVGILGFFEPLTVGSLKNKGRG